MHAAPRSIFVTSLPKSGTHLLTNVFERLGYEVYKVRKNEGTAPFQGLAGDLLARGNPGKPRAIFGHHRYKPVADDDADIEAAATAWVARTGIATLALVRDPRDVALSLVDFFASGRPRADMRAHSDIPRLSPIDLFRMTVRGETRDTLFIPSIEGRARGWTDWERAGALLLRYEELADIARSRPLRYDVRRFGVGPIRFVRAVRSAFGDSASETFNRGEARRWTREFTPEHLCVWDAEAGDALSALGYS